MRLLLVVALLAFMTPTACYDEPVEPIPALICKWTLGVELKCLCLDLTRTRYVPCSSGPFGA